MDADHRAQFHERVLDCLAEGVFTVDEDWRITSFNRAAERITGVAAADAIGRRCSEVFRADLCERGCAIRETLETGRDVLDKPARILTHGGRSCPIQVSAATLQDEEGNLLGAVETFRDLSALEQLRKEIEHRYTFEDIIGKSRALQRIFSILPDVAESDSTVLIEGPSGSGKELFARAIHNLSTRKKGPYVVVNCGTLPPPLFESELFGYVRGAFTGADRDKPGRIERAEGGTIFFDEVGELPPETQVKLLRLLQEREYEPLGGVERRHADVRIVAATNRRLAEMVSQRAFRDDLYFRLAVVRMTVPALEERREDIPYLVDHFIERFNAKRGKTIQGLTPRAMALLMRYDFPGNVRELENVIEYAFVLCHDPRIDVGHLPDTVVPPGTSRTPSAEVEPPLQRAEEQAVREALARSGGHVGRTAELLGVSRTTLWRKMKRYGISASDYASA